MNDRSFACSNCRCYTDAGYRWAYWQLEEPGVVQLAQTVDVQQVLKYDGYWKPPEGENSTWLCDEILPTVRLFLQTHIAHRILYIETDQIYVENSEMSDWVEVEYTSVKQAERSSIELSQHSQNGEESP
jgi:hypothetical protein